MVNNVKSNSPWKAKAHEHFNQLSHKEMKNYIGMTRFKQQKLSGLNLKSDEKKTLSNKFQSFLSETENDRAGTHVVHRMKQKLKNGRFVLDEEQNGHNINSSENTA